MKRDAQNNASSGAIYGLGLIGAAVWFISSATGFWMGVLGFLKALVWPALLVYEAFKALMAGLPVGCVGLITQEPALHITDVNNRTVIKADLATLKEAWQAPLRW